MDSVETPAKIEGSTKFKIFFHLNASHNKWIHFSQNKFGGLGAL